MTSLALAATAGLILAGTAAMAQTLPVKIHRQIASFEGNPRAVILERDGARYALVSAHKEAGRPWADALFWRYRDGDRTLISRAYDCAAGTYRWLGEGKDFQEMSASVRPGQTGDRLLEPGSTEFALAHHVCGL